MRSSSSSSSRGTVGELGDDVAHLLLGGVGERDERAPARLVGGDLGLLQPAAVDVAEEVVLRADVGFMPSRAASRIVTRPTLTPAAPADGRTRQHWSRPRAGTTWQRRPQMGDSGALEAVHRGGPTMFATAHADLATARPRPACGRPPPSAAPPAAALDADRVASRRRAVDRLWPASSLAQLRPGRRRPHGGRHSSTSCGSSTTPDGTHTTHHTTIVPERLARVR